MAESKTVTDWTEQRLMELGSVYWQSSTLHAAVSLGLFAPLARQPLSAKELARELNCDVRALAMLLRAVAALGLLQGDGERYACTDFSARCLDPGSAAYLGDILLHHYHLVPSWFQLGKAVVDGRPVGRSDEFSEEEWRSAFLRGMFNLANLAAGSLVPQIPLAGRKRLLDVGGGPGTYAARFCLHNPGLTADVFDLPTSRPYFSETQERFGLTGQIGFIPGDFLQDPLPGGYDVAWLSHVLHGESPKRCRELVAKAVAALNPGGLLIIHEFILDDHGPGPLFPALFSLNMLLQTEGGQSYAEQELRDLLQGEGLVQVERLNLKGGPSGVLLGRRPPAP